MALQEEDLFALDELVLDVLADFQMHLLMFLLLDVREDLRVPLKELKIARDVLQHHEVISRALTWRQLKDRDRAREQALLI